MVPCKSTAEEVSFEWSHHRFSSTDSNVRTTLHVSIIDSGNEGLIAELKVELCAIAVAAIIGALETVLSN